MSDPVMLEHLPQVSIVRMEDGENRINARWLEAMNSALAEVDARADPVALVTTGSGRFFSNGLDLGWLYGKGRDTMQAFVAEMEVLFARILTAPYVTVAACNGHTYAAGALLALCHDFRVMRADRGYFCIPEVDLGIPLTAGMDALVRARLSPSAAHEVMITGKRFGGAEAMDKGIVNLAVAEGEVLPEAVAIAMEHAGKNRAHLASIKERMYRETLELLRSSEGTSPR